MQKLENLQENSKVEWVQCDSCAKWRKLPQGFDMKKINSVWYCRNNTDKVFLLLFFIIFLFLFFIYF